MLLTNPYTSGAVIAILNLSPAILLLCFLAGVAPIQFSDQFGRFAI